MKFIIIFALIFAVVAVHCAPVDDEKNVNLIAKILTINNVPVSE